jgi:HSP20 family protein
MPTVIRKSASVTLTDKRRETLQAVGWQVQLRSSLWSPPTDVYETESMYVVRLEAAGMQEDDFEVTFEDGFLLIYGVRSDVSERRAYHQMEIHFGKFSTAILVPGPVNLDNSEAEYKDGFLTVKLPKVKATEIKVEE